MISSDLDGFVSIQAGNLKMYYIVCIFYE